MKMKFSILMLITVLFSMTVTVFAEESPRVFFAPQSMNESNEIIVPLYTQNLPKDNDGLCGIEFSFVYNTEQFSLKNDENGRPILGTSSAMLLKNTDMVDVSVNEDTVSVSYVDFSGEKDTVLRSGPLFYFTFIPKNPDALWNSDDYYPIRFMPDSVNLITFDSRNFALSGTSAEGIDTYMGGYNVFPTFEAPETEKEITFQLNTGEAYVDGELKENNALPYEKDEIMLPLRFLAENTDMEIYWDGDSRTVSLFRPYLSVYFNMSSGDVYINSKKRGDTAKSEIADGRTFVPLSAMQTIFGNSLNTETNSGGVSLKFN